MWLLWDALLFSPYPFFSHFTNFWVVAEHQRQLSHKLLLSCLVSLSFSFRFLLLVIALYLYPQQPSKTGVNKIPTHAHQHKWQDPYPLRIGPLVFIFFIFKEPSNLFLRMPIFKIFILTNLLIIPAIVAGVHFKTGQLLAPFSCTLKSERGVQTNLDNVLPKKKKFESCTFHQESMHSQGVYRKIHTLHIIEEQIKTLDYWRQSGDWNKTRNWLVQEIVGWSNQFKIQVVVYVISIIKIGSIVMYHHLIEWRRCNWWCQNRQLGPSFNPEH